MANYLVEPAVLEQIVDGLINEKYPNNTNLPAGLKNEAMRALDHQILKDILGSLTKEQGQELNAILEKDDSSTEPIEKFFATNHIDIEKVLQKTMVDFKQRFLEGGQNA